VKGKNIMQLWNTYATDEKTQEGVRNFDGSVRSCWARLNGQLRLVRIPILIRARVTIRKIIRNSSWNMRRRDDDFYEVGAAWIKPMRERW
jgi:replication-associated recombination protein RarA